MLESIMKIEKVHNSKEAKKKGDGIHQYLLELQL